MTVIVISGRALGQIGEACSVARVLAPAAVVVEDVDLIAEERTARHGEHPLLFQLLNEMEGLNSAADVTFLLTTNRADLLEPALAERPGRVDLAAELPLPDTAARRALIELLSGELGIRRRRPGRGYRTHERGDRAVPQGVAAPRRSAGSRGGRSTGAGRAGRQRRGRHPGDRGAAHQSRSTELVRRAWPAHLGPARRSDRVGASTRPALKPMRVPSGALPLMVSSRIQSGGVGAGPSVSSRVRRLVLDECHVAWRHAMRRVGRCCCGAVGHRHAVAAAPGCQGSAWPDSAPPPRSRGHERGAVSSCHGVHRLRRRAARR